VDTKREFQGCRGPAGVPGLCDRLDHPNIRAGQRLDAGSLHQRSANMAETSPFPTSPQQFHFLFPISFLPLTIKNVLNQYPFLKYEVFIWIPGLLSYGRILVNQVAFHTLDIRKYKNSKLFFRLAFAFKSKTIRIIFAQIHTSICFCRSHSMRINLSYSYFFQASLLIPIRHETPACSLSSRIVEFQGLGYCCWLCYD